MEAGMHKVKWTLVEVEGWVGGDSYPRVPHLWPLRRLSRITSGIEVSFISSYSLIQRRMNTTFQSFKNNSNLTKAYFPPYWRLPVCKKREGVGSAFANFADNQSYLRHIQCEFMIPSLQIFRISESGRGVQKSVFKKLSRWWQWPASCCHCPLWCSRFLQGQALPLTPHTLCKPALNGACWRLCPHTQTADQGGQIPFCVSECCLEMAHA